MFPDELNQELFDELSKELNNPKFTEMFNPDDLENMFILYKHISTLSDKVILITHMMAEMVLQERGILK